MDDSWEDVWEDWYVKGEAYEAWLWPDGSWRKEPPPDMPEPDMWVVAKVDKETKTIVLERAK